MMFRTRMVAAALSLAFTGLIPAAQATPASNEPRQAPAATAPESNWSRDFKEFTGRLETLAKENGIVFLVEGMPLRKLPPPADATRPDVNHSLAEKITAQVRDFDYEPVVLGKVVVLRKRYTDPQDTPSVTLEECDAAMADMVQIFHSGFPRGRSSRLYTEWIIDSLTPEQRKSLEAGTLAVRDITGSSRQAVDAWIVNLRFGGISDAAGTANRFLQPSSESIVIVPANPSASFASLVSGRPDGAYGVLRLDDRPDKVIPDTATIDGPEPDPANTLGSVVACINEKRKSDTPPIRLDEMFTAKTAMMVGDPALAPTDVFGKGLSLMYGLARRVGPNKEIVLTRHIVRVMPGDMAPDRLPDFLTRLLPDPIRRAIGFDDYARRLRDLAVRNQQAVQLGAGAAEEWRKVDQEERRLGLVPKTAQSWAALRLRERVWNQAADRSIDLRIPLSKLDAPARNLVAAATLLGVVSNFLTGIADVPGWLRTYPADLNLSGRVKDDGRGGKSADLDLVWVLPDGRSVKAMQVNSARYHTEAQP